MPEMEKGAGQPLTHDVSTNLTIGTVAQGARLPGVALPVPMRTISQSDFDLSRNKMVALCGDCHARAFARRNLEGADEIKADVDTLLWDPVMRIRGLWWDGLLDPMPENRAPNPNFGQALVLGGQQLYGGTSAIEQLFFYTYKYDHVNTFKGAYHINPDYSHWFGWSEVNQDLDLIKGEESKLRHLAVPYDPGFVGDHGEADQRGSRSPSTRPRWPRGATPRPTPTSGGRATAGTAMPAAEPSLAYAYAAAGTYTVELTCSDGDLVNDAANPTACSGKRTTSLRVTVKDAAKLTLAAPTRVKAGKTLTLNGKLTTASAGNRAVRLQMQTSSGGWKTLDKKTVTVAAGTATPVTFRYKLTKTTTFRLSYGGSAVGVERAEPGAQGQAALKDDLTLLRRAPAARPSAPAAQAARAPRRLGLAALSGFSWGETAARPPAPWGGGTMSLDLGAPSDARLRSSRCCSRWWCCSRSPRRPRRRRPSPPWTSSSSPRRSRPGRSTATCSRP